MSYVLSNSTWGKRDMLAMITYFPETHVIGTEAEQVNSA